MDSITANLKLEQSLAETDHLRITEKWKDGSRDIYFFFQRLLL